MKECLIEHVPIEERVFTFDNLVSGVKSLFNLPTKKVYFLDRCSSFGEELFNEDKNGMEIVILDRSIDLVTPLIHFFTFQSILMDYNLETLEEDDLYKKIKHKHIADVNKIIINESKSIINTVGNVDNTSSKNLMQLVLEVPEQIKLKESISFYLKQLNNVYDFYEMKNKEIVELEQNISTGYKADGSKFNLHSEKVFELFFNDFLQKEDKLRLFLLLSLKISFQENEMNLLLKKGIFTKEEINLSAKIKKLNFVPESKKTNFQYQISRYTPILHQILVDVIENKSKLKSLGEIKDVSLRKTGFSSGKRKRTVVVLINGCITYPEMCVIYDLSRSMNVDLFLGGKYVYTPRDFIEGLKNDKI